jgi:UDP-N-acetylmuramate--alanine ligase
MIDIRDIKKVYFIGIGGIGMSALARYFKFHGKAVSGYDKTETALTKQLTEEGIPVHYEENLTLAPRDAELIVFTPAIPKEHKELVYYQQNNYTLYKRSEVLGAITKSSFNICVAGTHGKTTVTTMVAHILRHSGYGCNAFLGGIAVNYDSNYWSHQNNVCVVEADEYDRSFLRLSPDIAVITAMDADHLDIYGTKESMEEAFIEFTAAIKPTGMLVSKLGLKRGDELKGSKKITYHQRDNSADAYAGNISMHHGSYSFDIVIEKKRLNRFALHMGGLHNIENIVAAVTVANHLGIDEEKIKAAVAAFKGVKRRFEYIIKEPGLVYIDDYAHHPEELRALIEGAKGLFPDLHCTVIFQPHLYTRTRDFADGFAEVLSIPDETYLLPIYPAREKPIAGVSSEMIAGKMPKGKAVISDKGQILDIIYNKRAYNRNLELIITAGAGDIDTLVEPIKEILSSER